MKAVAVLKDGEKLHISFESFYISDKNQVLFYEDFKTKDLHCVMLKYIDSIKVF